MRSRAAASGAALAALLALAAPVRAHDACEDRRLYRFCGEHLAASEYPLILEVSSAYTTAVTFANLQRAALDETEAWNQAWQTARLLAGRAAQPNPCGPADRLLCIASTSTTSAGSTGDGRNTIAYRPGLTGTCGEGSGFLAVTCLLYEAPTGAGRHRIVEADIFLDASTDLRAPTLLQLVYGEPAWSYPGPAPAPLCSPRWADLWSILAHELGHAAGLEHVASSYPGDLTDILPLRQTMWDTYRMCSTHQRSLAEGDLLGLVQVARAMSADGV